MNILSPVRSFSLRRVKTRAIYDPDQYDTEINSARGFGGRKNTAKTVNMPSNKRNDGGIFYDPDQRDPEANRRYSPPMDEASQLIDNFRTKTDVDHVTRDEVIDAQNFWAQSIVDISNCFLSGGDYVSLAGERAGELYGYDHSNVLFKPTKAAAKQFRPTANDAMSYFVGHDAVISGYKEDHGFAINAKKGFSRVIFDNHQIDCHNQVAIAMGTYEFTCATTGEISEVEYTFGYKRNPDGKVRICLHHSSIPYEPKVETPRVRRDQTSQVKRKSGILYDPAQCDPDAKERRHVTKKFTPEPFTRENTLSWGL
jgi:hypothetical protein